LFIKDAVLLIPQTNTSNAIFASPHIIGEFNAITVTAILAKIAGITGITIHALITNLALFAVATIIAINQGLAVFRITGIATLSAVKTHITILGDNHHIAIRAILTCPCIGPATRGIYIQFSIISSTKSKLSFI